MKAAASRVGLVTGRGIGTAGGGNRREGERKIGMVGGERWEGEIVGQVEKSGSAQSPGSLKRTR